ncbi:Aste57867_24359 [Aphanomyces stellatus]|uniref:Aste57867_24359 protein n=1 Tax=Aphanomyces stellatus TaxID=120398 RepID=A0A485LQ58_9STRA|nr:hypothetical protein As57867_024283 [Aphanomyces stellatus]VFU00999.1 Aste57867_24359 [Aphanomyces stellatus]
MKIQSLFATSVLFAATTTTVVAETRRSPSMHAAPTLPSPSESPTASLSKSTSTIKDMLIVHTNKLRAAHDLPSLSWDVSEAARLQAWADTCPGYVALEPSGHQNMMVYFPCRDCVKLLSSVWIWYNDEETKWNYDRHECGAGSWAPCGDFSNMMSPSVTSFGCGWSQCPEGNIVWCNYDTPVDNPVVPRRTNMTKAQLKASLTQ